MGRFRGIVAFGAFLGGIIITSCVFVATVEARCCDRTTDGCDGASESGCASGSVQNMFFPDPCECDQVSDTCLDPTNSNQPCGGTPGGECGDGETDSGEDCDDGADNGTFMSCCAADCSYKSDGAACDDGTFCDGLGACDGAGTCDENQGPQVCPDPERCDEEENRCQSADTPAASATVLMALAASMLAGAMLILRRRRQQRI